LWGGFTKTNKWWQVTQLLIVILAWPCKRKKKQRWTTMLLIVILVWFCKNQKMMTNSYIVHFHFNVVLQVRKINNEQLHCLTLL
jgi:cell division protein FtsB